MNFRQYNDNQRRGHGPIGYWNHNYFMAEEDNGGGGGGDGPSSSSSKFWIVPWDMDGETIYTRLDYTFRTHASHATPHARCCSTMSMSYTYLAELLCVRGTGLT